MNDPATFERPPVLKKEHPKLVVALEIIAAFVISVAAVLSSWASFQAALWDGEQAAYYAQAATARVISTRESTAAAQFGTVDLLMFQQWLSAKANNEPELQGFYRQRFRPEFAVAFNAWMATRPLEDSSAPTSPFALKDYRSSHQDQALALQKQADDLFDKGQRANDISDAFTRTTVLLAISLFFGGIGQTFKSPYVKAVLLGLAVICCTISAVNLAQLPIQAAKAVKDL